MGRFYNLDKYPNTDLKDIKSGDILKTNEKKYKAVPDFKHSCMDCLLFWDCFKETFCHDNAVHFIEY